jgi:hypothetical protein
MFNKSMPTLLLLCILAVASGCMNRATASLMENADLIATKAFYVVHSTSDDRGVDKLIQNNLVKRGFSATVGPEMPLPYKADAIVVYADKWVWDMTMYMLELNITLRNAVNNLPMAVGNSLHTSLSRKSPEEMVDEVLTNIFNEAKKSVKAAQ